jgi:hypothetical protein
MMTTAAVKLLQRMRASKSGWKRADLDKLYAGFGFHIAHGTSHDIARHPNHPELRTTPPRHKFLAKGYVEYAIKLIDKLHELEKEAPDES